MQLVDRLIIPVMKGRGPMHNVQIYAAIKRHAHKRQIRLTRNWRATVRNTLQRHCRLNKKYVGVHHFVHHDRGIWEVVW